MALLKGLFQNETDQIKSFINGIFYTCAYRENFRAFCEKMDVRTMFEQKLEEVEDSTQ